MEEVIFKPRLKEEKKSTKLNGSEYFRGSIKD